ncbi:hypothetical protein M9H77_17951 [Catharanthus roseus]|uniref:Uncharacterized protein n=1 Tax=Catharanthus roseus TaxID=4058 RepID=A0ACC0B643_CATRO|nr:hypothetical protein M9H77_17951 [Catharanthus roseus]
MKPKVDNEEEEVQCGCPFKLKGKQMAMSENWQLFVHDGRHNHALMPRKYTTSLPRLRGIGCRAKTWLKKFFAQVINGITRSSIETGTTTTYNMPLLKVVGMTLTRIPKEIGCSEDEVAEKAGLLTLFVHYLVESPCSYIRESLDRSINAFGMDTTNSAESEYSVLKLWLSTCHGDLDTVFMNIDLLIQSQIANIKSSLENSRTKEKFIAKGNLILRNISNKISDLPLKKI